MNIVGTLLLIGAACLGPSESHPHSRDAHVRNPPPQKQVCHDSACRSHDKMERDRNVKTPHRDSKGRMKDEPKEVKSGKPVHRDARGHIHGSLSMRK